MEIRGIERTSFFTSIIMVMKLRFWNWSGRSLIMYYQTRLMYLFLSVFFYGWWRCDIYLPRLRLLIPGREKTNATAVRGSLRSLQHCQRFFRWSGIPWLEVLRPTARSCEQTWQIRCSPRTCLRRCPGLSRRPDVRWTSGPFPVDNYFDLVFVFLMSFIFLSRGFLFIQSHRRNCF